MICPRHGKEIIHQRGDVGYCPDCINEALDVVKLTMDFYGEVDLKFRKYVQEFKEIEIAKRE